MTQEQTNINELMKPRGTITERSPRLLARYGVIIPAVKSLLCA